MRTREQWIKEFQPQAIDAIQQRAIQNVTVSFTELAKDLHDNLPDGDHKTVALRKLLECKQTAVHAISHTVPKETTDESTKDKDGSSKGKNKK